MNTETYLTQDEAAKVLRLSNRTLERYRILGTGPRFIRAGRRILYRSTDLTAWTEENTFSSVSEADAALADGQS